MSLNHDESPFPYTWEKAIKPNLPEYKENWVNTGVIASGKRYWIVFTPKAINKENQIEDFQSDDFLLKDTSFSFLEEIQPRVELAYRVFNKISNEWNWCSQMVLTSNMPLKEDEAIFDDEGVSYWMVYTYPELPKDLR